MGILPLDFHFPTRQQSGLRECGNREAISKGLWAAMENMLLVFLAVPQPDISAARSHAIFLASNVANNFRFAACIFRAAPVSLSAPATRSRCSVVTSAFRHPASPGS